MIAANIGGYGAGQGGRGRPFAQGGSGLVGARGLLPGFDDALHLHKYGAIALAFTAAALVLVTATSGRLGYRHGDATPGTDADRRDVARALDQNQTAHESDGAGGPRWAPSSRNTIQRRRSL